MTTVARTIEDLRRTSFPPRLLRRAIRLGRWKVDFLWRAQRVVVEADTWTYHRGSVSFEDDHARDLDLRAAGYTVLRFTDKQLEEEPGRVVADVARALTQEVPSSG